MKIYNFREFINETSIRDIEMNSRGEKAVYDLAEETLLSKDLIVICERDEDFEKYKQIVSSQQSKEVLRLTGHVLYHLIEPFEFLQWDIIGSTPQEVIETCFIVKEEDSKKI